jgi:Dolichyl-phosphate-mannose-protein mannosyltransferase
VATSPCELLSTTSVTGLVRADEGSRRAVPLWTAGRIVVAVAAAVPVAVYLYVALRRLGYPFELEWLEGGEVEIVSRVVHGQGIYVAPTLHYVPYPYPPLFIWVSAAFAKVLGVGFLAPRLVSFLASLGVLALLWDAVRRETGDPVAGLVAAGLFAATYQASGAYFDLARVDSLFLVLLLAAIAVARRAQTWRGGTLVGLLLFLSFFTKQTALIAAVPVLVYLVVSRRRVGLAGAVTLAALLAISTAALDHATHGWYVYYVFQELPSQGINARAIETFIPKSLLRPTGWAVVVGLAGLVVGWRTQWAGAAAGVDGGAGSTTRWPFWIFAGAGLVGASWLSLVHAGGSFDVLMPSYAAVAIFAGLGYDALFRSDPRHQALLGTLLAVAILVQLAQLDRGSLHEIPSGESTAAGHHFIALVASLPGQVIVADHPWYDTMAGKPSWAQSEAVHDVLRSGPGPARRDLLASIRATLASPSVTAVFGDDPEDTIGPGFDHYFRLGPAVFSCARCFFPVTDVPRRPYLHYVRR